MKNMFHELGFLCLGVIQEGSEGNGGLKQMQFLYTFTIKLASTWDS